MLYIQSDLPPLKAGTLFHPLFRLYLPVMVQVGAQVAVTAKPGTGIILQQQQHKHTQGVLLKKGACIGRATALVKTAFVADTDATCILFLVFI